MKNKIDSTPVLYGEDAERFEKTIENPTPVSKEEFERMKKSYEHFRKMGMYTVEDLKCCGNCISFQDISGEDRYSCKNNSVYNSHGVCKEWKFDALIQEDRK